MLKNLEYFKGSQTQGETIEGEIYECDIYKTTCVMSVYSLLSGINTFPCRNGGEYELKGKELIEILEYIEKSRSLILSNYPIKTYTGWQESGLPTFEDYCKPGDIVDKEMVDYFVGMVPPVFVTHLYVQTGEPYKFVVDSRGKSKPTYMSFIHLSTGKWKFFGYCFERETINRIVEKSRLQLYLEDLRKGE